MKKIDKCTTELIRMIQNSKEYIRFQKIREKVEKDPELHARINAFRMHVYDIQNSPDPLDMYAEQERLCSESEEIKKDPLVEEFLNAELSVCRILQRVMGRIAMEINLDTREIAEQIEP